MSHVLLPGAVCVNRKLLDRADDRGLWRGETQCKNSEVEREEFERISSLLVSPCLDRFLFSFKFDSISCYPIVRQSIQKSRHLRVSTIKPQSGKIRIKSRCSIMWLSVPEKIKIIERRGMQFNFCATRVNMARQVATYNSPGEQEVFFFLLKIVDRRSSPSPLLIVILLSPPPSRQFNYSPCSTMLSKSVLRWNH